MADIARAKLQEQLNFLDVAVKDGVDAAVSAHGNVLTASEALALKKLTPADLKSLRDVNAKIARARVPDLGKLAESDWTCVNVVC